MFVCQAACSGNNEERKSPVSKQDYSEALIKLNKKDLTKEDSEIHDYIKRYGWSMKRTGTGLWYMIYMQGDGPKAKPGDIVTINYDVGLLNGIECYSSDSEGPMVFELGKNDKINGLEEGILLMNKGDKAKLIVPSHLGFGLLGDMDKIPIKSTLVYDLEIIELKPKNNQLK